jgi:hypothetical protein
VRDTSETTSLPNQADDVRDTPMPAIPTEAVAIEGARQPSKVTAIPPDQPAALEFERLQLVTRLLVGFLAVGGDELFQWLREFQQEIDSNPSLLPARRQAKDETELELLRYLTIGLLVRGEKAIARGVSRGFRLSANATGWALGTLNRLTDNRLARPFRQRVERRFRDWEQETDLIIREGRREERSGRWLAGQTVNEITNTIMDSLADNPALDDLIQDMIGQQSVGLAGVVMDNTRQVTTTADYVVEGVLRRLLRRPSRQALPPSPLEGKPQEMYQYEDKLDRTVQDGG